jgi:hypothetical protein
MIEAELQAVLNTLTEHDFKVHLKMAEVHGTVYSVEGDCFEGDSGQCAQS